LPIQGIIVGRLALGKMVKPDIMDVHGKRLGKALGHVDTSVDVKLYPEQYFFRNKQGIGAVY
jgi:hypothetical protein